MRFHPGVIAAAFPATPQPTTSARLEVAHHETMPNPGHQPDAWTIRDGAWSDRRTWSGGVLPTATTDAYISHAVTLTDTGNAVRGLEIADGGVLTVARDANTGLTLTTVAVNDGGELNMGEDGDPVQAAYTSDWVVRNEALPAQSLDWHQFSNGILVLDGGTWRACGATKTPYARLGITVAVDDEEIELEAAPAGWRVGDAVVLPFSDPVKSSDTYVGEPVNEEFVVASVSDTTVAITTPVEYEHPGAKDKTGTTVFRPHLVNLTRNVVIRSENAGGVRGHTLFAERADVDLRWTRFTGLGRTRGTTLNSTTVTSETPGGNVTHYGTNQVGRYPVHAHHCFGPVNPGNTGHQFRLEGLVTDDCRKWGHVIHGSSYGYVKDCVAWDYEAAGLSFETGSEWYNEVEDCFFGGGVNDGLNGQTVVNSIWLVGASMNAFRDVVCAANVQPLIGIPNETYLGHGLHYDRLGRGGVAGSSSKKPLYRGADVLDGIEGDEYETAPMAGASFGEFDGLEGYGMFKVLSFDHVSGGSIDTILHAKNVTGWGFWTDVVFIYGGDTIPIVLENLRAYRWVQIGISPNTQQSPILIDGGEFHIHADDTGFQGGSPTVAIARGGAGNNNDWLTVRNVDIHCPICVQFIYRGLDGTEVVADEPLSRLVPAVVMALDGVTTSHPTWSGSAANRRFDMDGDNPVSTSKLILAQAFILNHEGNAGEHYQLFWDQQDPSEPPPDEMGTTEATNQEQFDLDGRCWGGELMPAGADALTGLTGGKALAIDPPTVTGPYIHAMGGKLVVPFSALMASHGASGADAYRWWTGTFPGLTLTASGGPVSLTWKRRPSSVQIPQAHVGAYFPAPDDELVFNLSRPIAAGETCTLTLVNTGLFQAMPGVGLLAENFTGLAVTNNSTNDGDDTLAVGLEREWLLDEVGPGPRAERVYTDLPYDFSLALVDAGTSVGSAAGIDGDGLAARFDADADDLHLTGFADAGLTAAEKLRTDHALWNQPVNAAPASGLPVTAVTGQVWVYLESAPSVFDIILGANDGYGWSLMYSFGGGFRIRSGSAGAQSPDGSATTGVWHHLLWSYDPDTGGIRLVHNGTAYTGTGDIGFGPGQWRLGSQPGANAVRARLAWHRIWHRALTVDEEAVAFAARPPVSSSSPFLLGNYRSVISGGPISS